MGGGILTLSDYSGMADSQAKGQSRLDWAALFIPLSVGPQKAFPAAWRGSPVWSVPALLPLALLIYWALRVWFTKTYNPIAPAPETGKVARP